MIQDFPYLYDTHIHTNRASKCGMDSPADMVRARKEGGFTGIILTEHNWKGNTAFDRNLPWAEWVKLYVDTYYEAKEAGDRIGLDVFWGYEAGSTGAIEFLVYGLEPEWLFDHPELRHAEREVHMKIARDAGAMVIQAHPFRKRDYIPEVKLFPELVHGAEVFNAGNYSREDRDAGRTISAFDEKALAYAKEYGLLMTAGSDGHSVKMRGAGMAFKRKLADIKDFCAAVMGGEEYLMYNGKLWFDRRGEPVTE